MIFMNKKVVFFIILLIIIISSCFMVNYYFNEYLSIELIDSKLINYNEEDRTITILMKRKINKYNNNFTCHADGNNNKYEKKGNNNECELTLKISDSYKLYLTNQKGNKSNIINLNDTVSGILSFKFIKDTIYLIKDEEENIVYYDVVIDKKIDYDFKSENPEIAVVVDNKVVGKNIGKTYIYSDKIDSKMDVVVTNLITSPYATKEKKTLLPCNAFNEEEGKILDDILEYKIENAGFQTRAGAVAAARFLTLEFPYRVPYFYENGRVPISQTDKSNINTHIADGEGRYYKKGLYLTNNKKELITASWRGPSIWGCNLVNLEENKKYGYIPGKLMPNGLDCSGFITWTLKNAGFEPGDVGAGEDSNRDGQCTDLGEFTLLADNIDNIKTGDLLNWWGHIAMLIGINDDTYYVAESLSYIGGVRAMIYTKKELLNTFKYTVLMDNYYKEEGNYSVYWQL